MADEGDILLQAFPGNARAVAVGEFVAEAGAEAGLADGFVDGGEGAAHGVGAGVVVDERRCAVTDAVQQRHQGAVVAVLGGQGRVEPPPEVLQHFDEVASRLGFRKAAGEGAVEVGVGIDEARSHQLARGVDPLPGGDLQPGCGSDAGDHSVLDENGMVVEDGWRCASG